MRVGIVGCGIFGLAAALELRDRGHAVTVFEQGRVPYEKAASTDTSKTIQRLYGHRDLYVELAERAEAKWRHWREQVDGSFYFEIGHVIIAREPGPRSRALDSYAALRERGNATRLLSLSEARARFPQFAYPEDGVVLFDAWGGYLASGQAVADLARLAKAGGVQFHERANCVLGPLITAAPPSPAPSVLCPCHLTPILVSCLSNSLPSREEPCRFVSWTPKLPRRSPPAR